MMQPYIVELTTNAHRITSNSFLDFDPNESNCLRDLNLCIRLHQGADIELPSSQTLFTHSGSLMKTIKEVKF